MQTKAACSRCRTFPRANRIAPAPGSTLRRTRFLVFLTGTALLFLGSTFGLKEPTAAAQGQPQQAAPQKAQPPAGEEGPPELPIKKAKPKAPPVTPKKAQPPAGEEGPSELTVKMTKKAGGQGWSGSLTAEQQKAVNAAIDRGVAYLRQTQKRNGSWSDKEFTIGYAALAGLTLLECGVPADDPAIKKAALHVRFSAATLNHTYQISLAILFLDRLGNTRDRKLIQTLGLRLVAGQNAAGGWTYSCPVLKTQEEQMLLAYLRQRQPKHLQEGIAWAKPGSLLHESIVDAKQPMKKTELAEGIPDTKKSGETTTPTESKLGDPLPSDTKSKTKPRPKGKTPKKAPPEPKVVPIHRQFLPPNVRNLPVVGPRGASGKIDAAEARDDNSNSQFAIIALWAARRHWVPMERTLSLVDDRYRTSQHPDAGGWGYQLKSGQTPAMTCVGLIGLAVGHASAREAMEPGTAPLKQAAQDEAISRGLRALGGYIQPGSRQTPGGGLYLLWSLERVGVLYGLKTIGNKDWYRWGVEILLPGQQQDGSWSMQQYHGSSPALDTSMALLFLKRANLTQDLTRTIRLQMAITDPDAAPAVENKK
jgi:hypothetical protein